MAVAELLLLASQAEDGMQPIHVACGNDLIEIFRLLLDAGADAKYVDGSVVGRYISYRSFLRVMR